MDRCGGERKDVGRRGDVLNNKRWEGEATYVRAWQEEQNNLTWSSLLKLLPHEAS